MQRYVIALITLSILGRCQAIETSERILRFHSDIIVRENRIIGVRETIKIHSSGQAVRHGIYREFVPNWNRPAPDFTIIEIRKNGFPEPYTVQKIGRINRIYIGSPNSVLPVGNYTYELTYETPGQVQSVADFDRLYWNVTGNGWQFPIDEVSARVQLPVRIAVNKISATAYVGRYGSVTQDDVVSTRDTGFVSFAVTRPLAISEGMTVVVDWPARFTTHPWSFRYFVNDNRVPVIGIAGIVVLSLYYFIAWLFVRTSVELQGKHKLVVSGPPENISAAGARYIHQMFLDNKTFTAAIVSMGAHGVLQIREDGTDYTIIRMHADFRSLAPEERAIANILFASGDLISIKMDHRRIRKAVDAFKNCMHERYSLYLAKERTSQAPAWSITAIAVALCFTLELWESKAWLVRVVTWIVLLTVFLVVNKFGRSLLQKPTEIALHMQGQLEGFREYLRELIGAAKEDTNSARTTFERYIAFALAFDLEAEWAQHFHSALNTEVDGAVYRPKWYLGKNFRDFYIRTGAFGGAISQAAVAAYAHSADVSTGGASTAGSSGSAGGGVGGFSGGGGGAGGGGGW